MAPEGRERPTDASSPDPTLLTAALEATEDGLVVFDTDGWIRYCNERLVRDPADHAGIPPGQAGQGGEPGRPPDV